MLRIFKKTCSMQRAASTVHLSILVAIALSIGTSQAQDEEETPVADADTSEQAEEDAELVPEDPAAGLMSLPGSDAIGLPPICRDPFWPVGFNPNPPVATAAPAPSLRPEVRLPQPVRLPEPGAVEWSTARRQLKPTVGRSVDPDGNEQFFTILNNRLVNAGQTVSVTTPVFSFTWRVVRITEAGVEFLAVEARRLSDGKRFPAATN